MNRDVTPSKILIYEALILFLKEAYRSQISGRSLNDVTGVTKTLEGYLLSMACENVVSAIVTSLEYRKTLLELSTKLGLANDPNLRAALRTDDEGLAMLLVSIFHSKTAEAAVLRLEGDQAQCFLDVVQKTLDKGFLITQEHSQMARRIICKLYAACDRLPSALFITGVSGKEEHPTFGGGYGDIYRASHGNRTVALKYMRAVHFMRGSELRRIRLKFCQEALVWKDLDHPHILPFLGIDGDSFPSSLCMVSPWMEHGTVMNYLHDHGHANVDKLLYEIAQGLQYLHTRNIVHGDLRGSNILINENWSACLADFGLSVFSDVTSSMSTNRGGSLHWMAPELLDPDQFEYNFVRTPATDVYAFGCLCFELYTGRPPFSRLHDPAALMKVINGERPERPSGPPAMSNLLWRLVTQCWAQTPTARPSTQLVVQNMVWQHPLPLIPNEESSLKVEIRMHHSAGLIVSPAVARNTGAGSADAINARPPPIRTKSNWTKDFTASLRSPSTPSTPSASSSLATRRNFGSPKKRRRYQWWKTKTPDVTAARGGDSGGPSPYDDLISLPWNFQHTVHVDEDLIGLPPSWVASLREVGFSDNEIAVIQQRRLDPHGRLRGDRLATSTSPPFSTQQNGTPNGVLMTEVAEYEGESDLYLGGKNYVENDEDELRGSGKAHRGHRSSDDDTDEPDHYLEGKSYRENNGHKRGGSGKRRRRQGGSGKGSDDDTGEPNLGSSEEQQQRALDHAQARAHAQGGELPSRRSSNSSVLSAASPRADSILESFPFVPPSPISGRPMRSPDFPSEYELGGSGKAHQGHGGSDDDTDEPDHYLKRGGAGKARRGQGGSGKPHRGQGGSGKPHRGHGESDDDTSEPDYYPEGKRHFENNEHKLGGSGKAHREHGGATTFFYDCATPRASTIGDGELDNLYQEVWADFTGPASPNSAGRMVDDVTDEPDHHLEGKRYISDGELDDLYQEVWAGFTGPTSLDDVTHEPDRYLGWVAATVAPLQEFIDEVVDPHEFYGDLQEIAEGESGSVFSAELRPGAYVHKLRLPSLVKVRDADELAKGRRVLVAMKCVALIPGGSQKLVDVRKECSLLHGLRCEQILGIDALYVDVVEDSLWVRMELMERSLADVVGLKEEGLYLREPRIMARFASDMLQALNFLQKHHIAHCDLRSDNLLLNSEGVLKLTDFSNAVRVTSESPLETEPVGVLYWQAPEVRSGAYDPLKIDVWSVGATVWELAEGAPPFSETQKPAERWPPLSESALYAPVYHDFLRMCSEPAASRPTPGVMHATHFVQKACDRSIIVQLLARCMALEQALLEDDTDAT